jgi:hypothetical protein
MAAAAGRGNDGQSPSAPGGRRGEGLLLLGALAFFLPLAELLLRALAPQPLPSQATVRRYVLRGMYVADDRAGYRPAPGFSGTIGPPGDSTAFSMNALGLRGAEVGPKTKPRLLALGDSMTWGWGVPQGEEWVHWAGREIARLGGPEVESLNGGVNGYGTGNEAARLDALLPVLEPDLVLVGFFGNDFADNLLGTTEAYTVEDGYLFDRASHEWLQEHWLARESHLYRLLRSAGETFRIRFLHGIPSTRPGRRLSPGELRRGMELGEGHLRRMAEALAASGARLAVVWLPSHAHALSGVRPEQLELPSELQRRVAAAGIPSLDLLPATAADPDRQGLYRRGDGHFTVRGHRRAGAAVGRWILEAKLLPATAEDD